MAFAVVHSQDSPAKTPNYAKNGKNNMKEFIALHNRTVSRDEIQTVIALAKEQNNTEVIYRLSKILNDHPDSKRFNINIINYPQETTQKVGLAGTRHSGDYREALDECGRLKKGWHFVDGKVVKVQKRSGLLSQYTEKEFGHPFPKALKEKFKELNWKYDRKNKRYYTPVPENEAEKEQQAQMFAFIEQEKSRIEANGNFPSAPSSAKSAPSASSSNKTPLHKLNFSDVNYNKKIVENLKNNQTGEYDLLKKDMIGINFSLAILEKYISLEQLSSLYGKEKEKEAKKDYAFVKERIEWAFNHNIKTAKRYHTLSACKEFFAEKLPTLLAKGGQWLEAKAQGKNSTTAKGQFTKVVKQTFDEIALIAVLSERDNDEIAFLAAAGIDYFPEAPDDETQGLGKPVPAADIYKMVTDKIIGMLKSASPTDYHRAWKDDAFFIPLNYDSKKPYRGVNRLLLQERIGFAGEFRNPYFLTFKQIKKHKGTIKKGAKGYEVIYYSIRYVVPADKNSGRKAYSSTNAQKVLDFLHKYNLPESEVTRIPMIRYYNVYNGADIENIDFKLDELQIGRAVPDSATENRAAQLIVENYPNPPAIKHEGNQAYYNPASDYIKLPKQEQFDTVNDYYRTLFHELTHSTGHNKRLNRGIHLMLEKDDYAKEELVAEFGAVFLSAWAGIMWYNNKNHAAYLKGWNSAIKEAQNDNKFLMRAASLAQQSTDYILNLNPAGQPAFLKKLQGTKDTKNTKNNKEKNDSIEGFNLENLIKDFNSLLNQIKKENKDIAPEEVEDFLYHFGLSYYDEKETPYYFFFKNDIGILSDYKKHPFFVFLKKKNIISEYKLTPRGKKVAKEFKKSFRELQNHKLLQRYSLNEFWWQLKRVSDKLKRASDKPAPSASSSNKNVFFEEYRQLKAKYPEHLIIVSMEDHQNYCMYGNDAVIAANILKLQLLKLKRNDEFSISVGFKYKNLREYLEKLVKAGYKVALKELEEVETLKTQISAYQGYIDNLKDRFINPSNKDFVNPTAPDYMAVKKIADDKIAEYNTKIQYYQSQLMKVYQNKQTYIKPTGQTALFGKYPETDTDRFKKMKVSELRTFTMKYYNLYLKGDSATIEKYVKEVVFINTAGRKIAYGEAMYSAKAAVIAHLKTLIKNSTYNNWGDRKASDGKDVLGYLNFKSKITIDNKKRHVRISLVVYKDRRTELKNVEVGKNKKVPHFAQDPVGTLQDGRNETLSNESVAKTVPNSTLSAPRHAGILKEALTEKGKLKKGWYFQDYGIIDPKGKYHPLERDYSLEYNLIEKELRDRAFQQDEKRKIKGFEENKKLEEAIKVFLKELSKENKKHFKNSKAMEVFYWAFPFTLERNSTFYTFEESNPYINKNLQELDKYFSDDNELFERLENYETLRRYKLKSLGLHISTKISSFIDKQGKVIRGDSNKLNQKYGLSAPEVFVEHSPDPATQSAPSITPRNNSIANKMATLQNRTFETFIIAEPQMQAFLGDVERKNTGSTAITITGGAGSGKTRFAFQFINALAQNYKVGHASLEEQPDSKLYFDKVQQYLDQTAQANVEAPEIENMQDLQALIERNDVIVIDSFTKIREWNRNFLLDRDLRKKYNGKLFLIIFQQTVAGNMRGGTTSEFDGDIILYTQVFPDYRENYIYPSKNRYNSTPSEQLRYSVYHQQLLPSESTPPDSSPVTSNTYEVIY